MEGPQWMNGMEWICLNNGMDGNGMEWKESPMDKWDNGGVAPGMGFQRYRAFRRHNVIRKPLADFVVTQITWHRSVSRYGNWHLRLHRQ